MQVKKPIVWEHSKKVLKIVKKTFGIVKKTLYL